MGQISLPVVNRTGIYSHWAGSGDNVYNYSTLLKQNIFISLLLSLFFKKKFFLYNHIKKSNLYTHWEFTPLKGEEEFKEALSKNSDITDQQDYIDKPTGESLKEYLPSSDRTEFKKYVLRENAYYLNLIKLVSEKIALELPLYAGKILFLKQRGILINLVFFFQPPKGEWKPKIKARNYYKHTTTPIGNLIYQSDINYLNPLYYDKHIF